MPRRTSVGNADRVHISRLHISQVFQHFFSSFPASRIVIPWFGLFARIVLRVQFRTCIGSLAGRIWTRRS